LLSEAKKGENDYLGCPRVTSLPAYGVVREIGIMELRDSVQI
jgi:hypothetical protein